MRRLTRVVPTVVLTACVWAAAQVHGEGDRARVSLVADNQPAQSVAAAITEQSGVQVALTETTTASLTGQLTGAGIEGAVRMLAAGAQASWLRAYIVERQPPEVPYTAEELIDRLDGARRAFWESLGRGAFWENLTAEERRALLMEWRALSSGPDERQPVPHDVDSMPPEQPELSAGTRYRLAMEGPGGEVALILEDGWATDPMRYDDPVADLLMPLRSDTISLDLSEVPLAKAITEFTVQSGYLVIVDEALDGMVTLDLEDGEPDEALAAFAEAVGAQWRPFYLLGQPRELTQQEVAERQQQFQQRRQEMITRAVAEFWQLPPEERAGHVQSATRYLEELPPDRRERIQPLVTRALPYFVAYAATLTTEQRLELKPLLQALARMAGQ